MNHKTQHHVPFQKYLSYTLLVFIVFASMSCQVVKPTIKQTEKPLFHGSEWYYRFYAWHQQKNLELMYYANFEKEQNIAPQIEESMGVGPKIDGHKIDDYRSPPYSTDTKTVTPAKNTLQPPKKRIPGAIIHASLTSSPGAVAISGSRYQVKIQIDGQPIEEENFATSAASSFTILAEGQGVKKTFQVNSPSFGTNRIVQSVTLSINPLNNTASISGKINLDLPGTMGSSLINLSNGSSSSCEVRQGYFSSSVRLSEGFNQLTAVGKWLTITLELPSISVLVQS